MSSDETTLLVRGNSTSLEVTGTVTPDKVNRTFNVTTLEVTRSAVVDQKSILVTVELDVVEGSLGTNKVKSQIGNVVGLLVSVGDNHVVNLDVGSSDSQNS